MDLARALRDAIRRGPDEQPRPGRARSFPEVLDVFGGVSPLAAKLTGTEGLPYRQRGPEFRASVRRLQRYRQGARRPSGAFLRELRHMATREQSRRRRLDRREQLITFGSPIRLRGQVAISSESTYRTVGAHSAMFLAGNEWLDVIEALERGDDEGAESAFESALSERHFYGAAARFTDLEWVETR